MKASLRALAGSHGVRRFCKRHRARRTRITLSVSQGRIFRAARRGDSTFVRKRVESVARELAGGGLRADRGKAQLLYASGRGAWMTALAGMLQREGMSYFAEDVGRPVQWMPTIPRAGQAIAHSLHARIRDDPETSRVGSMRACRRRASQDSCGAGKRQVTGIKIEGHNDFRRTQARR